MSNANGQHPDTPTIDTQIERVLAVLEDGPETVITRHVLREGTCSVLVAGNPEDREGIIVQSDAMSEEPTAFGQSAEAIARLLPHLTGWSCLNVPIELADALIEPVAEAAEASGVRFLDDVFHVLTAPPPAVEVEGARLLERSDIALLRAGNQPLIGDEVDRIVSTLEWGHVGVVIKDDQIVALAHTFAQSEGYVDIGVVTHPDYRQQGFAVATGSLVAGAILAGGRIPVWSTGGTNLGSLAAAKRIGFREVSRRVYLIPEFDDES